MIFINEMKEMIQNLEKRQAECMERFSADNEDLEAVIEFNRIASAINKAYDALKEIDNKEGESL